MAEAKDHFVVHDAPVWRDRADFIVHAELPKADHPRRFEQLWTTQVAADKFEVCCIPFFLYDVALGDVVLTAPRGHRRYVVERVVRPSDRYVFRVWFGSSFHSREGIAEELSELGALTERSSLNLLSVDADSTERAQAVADHSDAREKLGELTYETGRSS